MTRDAWAGVVWAPIDKGRCTKHNEMVGPFTGLCYSCHREQLETASVPKAQAA